jgi:flagellar capping protein FliD
MTEVIPDCEEKDISDDNGNKLKSLPSIPGENGEEAAVYGNSRMFTISQFHQLFHYFLRKSDARDRLDQNDSDTAELQRQVAELERWREDLEGRFKDRSDFVNDKFASDDTRFSNFKDETIFEFNNCAKKFIINDEREEETQRTFK